MITYVDESSVLQGLARGQKAVRTVRYLVRVNR